MGGLLRRGFVDNRGQGVFEECFREASWAPWREKRTRRGRVGEFVSESCHRNNRLFVRVLRVRQLIVDVIKC